MFNLLKEEEVFAFAYTHTQNLIRCKMIIF